MQIRRVGRIGIRRYSVGIFNARFPSYILQLGNFALNMNMAAAHRVEVLRAFTHKNTAWKFVVSASTVDISRAHDDRIFNR